MKALSIAFCAENINGDWKEYSGGSWFNSKATLKCVDNKRSVSFESQAGYTEDVREAGVLEPGKDEFFWKLENWAETWNQIETTQYIQSPDFVTEEGYAFNLHIYPKGSNASHPDYISIYAYQKPSENDNDNVWPLAGKQVTLGIVEQEKTLEDRITMRRSFVTTPEWNNPSSSRVSTLIQNA